MATEKDKILNTAGYKMQESDRSLENRPSKFEETDDADYTSSSGSSSEGNESQSVGVHELDSEVQSETTKIKPNSGLKSRLAAFLPEIERSNRELELGDSVHARRIDNVSEHEEHYIEMSLGLGVLSDQQPDEMGIKINNGGEEDIGEKNVPKDITQQNLKGLNSRRSSSGRTKIQEL